MAQRKRFVAWLLIVMMVLQVSPLNVLAERQMLLSNIQYGGKYHPVTFTDMNDNTLVTQLVLHGEAAVEPDIPDVEGYAFTGWTSSIEGSTVDSVTADNTVFSGNQNRI